jgi:hypothetical protein
MLGSERLNTRLGLHGPGLQLWLWQNMTKGCCRERSGKNVHSTRALVHATLEIVLVDLTPVGRGEECGWQFILKLCWLQKCCKSSLPQFVYRQEGSAHSTAAAAHTDQNITNQSRQTKSTLKCDLCVRNNTKKHIELDGLQSAHHVYNTLTLTIQNQGNRIRRHVGKHPLPVYCARVCARHQVYSELMLCV